MAIINAEIFQLEYIETSKYKVHKVVIYSLVYFFHSELFIHLCYITYIRYCDLAVNRCFCLYCPARPRVMQECCRVLQKNCKTSDRQGQTGG